MIRLAVMFFSHDIDRRLKSAIAPVLCVCAIAYFGYHSVQGDRGLIGYARLTAELERARMALADTQSERLALAHRVGLLNPDHIDTDMLDEQARRQLGLAHPDDVVIRFDD